MLLMGMYVTTFLLGISGSMHCACMCGPLIGSACKRSFSLKTYFMARVLAYSFLGLLSGEITSFLKPLFLNSTKIFAILFGLTALIAAVYQFVFFRKKLNKPGIQNVKSCAHSGNRLSHRPVWFRSAYLGFATAFIPCGFLYIGVVQAAMFADPIKSSVSMTVFAVSTTPALWFGGRLIAKLAQMKRPIGKFVIPFFTIAAAALVLWRGLNQPLQVDKVQSDSNQLYCH